MNSSNGNSVGQALRNAREQMGISLDDAAKATSIKSVYLQELESDHPEKFSSEAQARGFLRLYAKFLHLSFDELVLFWDQPQVKTAAVPFSPPEPLEANTGKPLTQADAQTDLDDQDLGSEKDEKQSAAEDGSEIRQKDRKTHPLAKAIQSIHQGGKNIKLPEKISSLLSRKDQPDPTQEGESPSLERQVSSHEAFNEIGSALKEQRLQMQLSLSDIEQFTNIKRMYLEAIEGGRFSDLPSTVQGRGMLNNYAQFMAMDESAVMDKFARALQIQREELLAPRRKQPQPALTVRLNLPAGVRRVLNPDLLVGGLLIIALFAFIIWGVNLMLSDEDEPAAGAPSISDVLQITPSATPFIGEPEATSMEGENGDAIAENEQPAGAEAAPPDPTPVATINAAPLQLYIIAHDRAFMKVVVDGVEAFNGRVLPNNVYTYSGQNLIDLLTGNGAALEVYFNQAYLGELGKVGEVVTLKFSPDGLATPTPSAESLPAEDMQSE